MIYKNLRRIPLTSWILIAMVVGVLIGTFAPAFAMTLKPVSTVFLRMIKSIIVPLIFGTLVVGIAGHGDDMKRVGRLALKSIIYFEIVTTLALVIGLAAVNLVRPGEGVVLAASAEAGKELASSTQTPAGFLDELRGQAKDGRRKYRPDEIEAIVNRAAEIDVPSEAGSMTIGGVERIARDVGIDTQAVRSAVVELSPRTVSSRDSALEQPKSNHLIGGPTRLLYQRVVNGELAEGDYPLLVDEIRTIIGEVGQVSQLGHSFTWVLNKGSSGIRNIEVAVTVRSGKTRITVQENLGSLIGAIFGGIGGGLGGGGTGPMVGITAGALHAPEALAFMIPAWLGLVYLTARTSYYYAVRRRQKTLTYLIDRLADLSRELIGEPRLLPPGQR